MRLVLFFVFLVCNACAAFAACEGRVWSKHISGPEVCIPAEPKRIVTLDPLLTLGILTELEVPVAGAPVFGIQDQQVRTLVENRSITDIGHPLQPSLERIAALKPDLIIGSGESHGQIYEKMSAIAPTLLIDHIDWKEHVRMLAEISGRTEAAEQALARYEERVKAIKARIPADLKVSVARVRPGGFNIYMDGPAAYAPYAVLHEAGVRRTAFETVTDKTVVKRIDWEGVGALDGDIMLYVVVSGYNPGPDDELAAVTLANPFWQMLPAVEKGRAFRVDRATWMGFHGVASAHQVLDDIERYILAAP